MRTIAIVNQKGGCGKTTTAINLSACLAQKNKRVLLIDMDPQSHASIGLEVNVESLVKTIYNVLLEDGSSLKDIALSLSKYLSLAPSHTILSTIEQKLAGVNGRENRLKKAISSLNNSFDFIIIDTPPNIGLLTFNALRACQEAIVPIDPSFFSLHGVAKLIQTIGLLKDKYQQDIRIKALATMYRQQTRFSQEILEDINKFFKQNTYQTTIRNTVKIREAASYGQSIIEYAGHSEVAGDYISLSQEVIREGKTPSAENFADLTREANETGQYVIFDFKSPQANDVRVVGDFNGWNPDNAVSLIKQKDGIWKKPLYLEPGNYQYKFVVDGKWVNDPDNDKSIPNEFGETNSLLIVEPHKNTDKGPDLII
jgi:chromosome partitioning protein